MQSTHGAKCAHPFFVCGLNDLQMDDTARVSSLRLNPGPWGIHRCEARFSGAGTRHQNIGLGRKPTGPFSDFPFTKQRSVVAAMARRTEATG